MPPFFFTAVNMFRPAKRNQAAHMVAVKMCKYNSIKIGRLMPQIMKPRGYGFFFRENRFACKPQPEAKMSDRM